MEIINSVTVLLSESEARQDEIQLTVWLFAVAITFIVLIINKIDGAKKKKKYNTPKALPNRTGDISGILTVGDKTYNFAGFSRLACDTLSKIIGTWCYGDIKGIKSVFRDNVYHSLKDRLKEKQLQNNLDKVQNLHFDSCYLSSYKEEGKEITVGCVITGGISVFSRQNNRYENKRIDYIIKFSRTKDGAGIAHYCPNCGAAVTQGAIGKCSFCGLEISASGYNWIVSEISRITGDTRDEGIRQ